MLEHQFISSLSDCMFWERGNHLLWGRLGCEISSPFSLWLGKLVLFLQLPWNRRRGNRIRVFCTGCFHTLGSVYWVMVMLLGRSGKRYYQGCLGIGLKRSLFLRMGLLLCIIRGRRCEVEMAMWFNFEFFQHWDILFWSHGRWTTGKNSVGWGVYSWCSVQNICSKEAWLYSLTGWDRICVWGDMDE